MLVVIVLVKLEIVNISVLFTLKLESVPLAVVNCTNGAVVLLVETCIIGAAVSSGLLNTVNAPVVVSPPVPLIPKFYPILTPNLFFRRAISTTERRTSTEEVFVETATPLVLVIFITA